MIIAPIPFADFTADVLAMYHPPLRRVSTFRKMRQILTEFGRLCPSTEALSPSTVARWITEHPRRRASTVRTLLVALRAAVRYGESRGLLRSPFAFRNLAAWVPRTDDEPITRHLTVTEVARILAQADREAQAGDWRARRLQVTVYLAAYTGARASELLALRLDDVDLANGLVTIRPNARRALKTASSRRRLPIPGPLRRVLEPWIGRTDKPSEWLIPHTELDGPWLHGADGHKARQQVKALGRRAGVERVTLLAFRHAFATAADHFQIGDRALQELMGHSSPATQWRYRHADIDALRRAADRVRFDPPTPPLPGGHNTPPPSPGA